VQEAHRAFVAALPDLAAVLRQQAQRNNPALTVTVKIDRRAVEAAREAQAAAGRGGRQSDEREELVHTLQGLSFFDMIFPRNLIENALNHLDGAARQLFPDALSNAAMSKALNKVASALEDLRRFARLHGAARQALSIENIRGVVRWHQAREHPLVIEMKHDMLTLQQRSRPPQQFRLPVITPLSEAPLLLFG
jgi:hypothetical protein